MGYLYLACVALLFSFGGTCVKLINPYFNSTYMTFFRFAVGVFFLVLLKLVHRRSSTRFLPAFKACLGWILFGAITKWFAYLAENYALSQGPSFSNIIVQPVQTIFLTFISIFFFKEKLSAKKIGCIILCLCGVLCISWNGRSLDAFFQENFFLTALFILGGIFTGCHVLAQKMIGDRMDKVDSNLTIFSISGILAATPLIPDVAGGGLAGIRPDIACIGAIFLFGFNTGMGYYLNSKAIPLVPFYMVPIIQNMMVIFAITWGILFFHETVTFYIICGTLMFLTGLISLQLMKN